MCHFLLVISIQPPDSIMTYDYTQHICSFLDCFALDVLQNFEQSSLCWTSGVCGVSVRYTNFCANVDGLQEGDNPCKLSITDTDFCVYVRDADFVFMWEGGARKEIFLVDYLLKILIYMCIWERKEVILVDFLLQIQISVYTLEIQILCKCGRNEGR